jgi:hypothetical protein
MRKWISSNCDLIAVVFILLSFGFLRTSGVAIQLMKTGTTLVRPPIELIQIDDTWERVRTLEEI